MEFRGFINKGKRFSIYKPTLRQIEIWTKKVKKIKDENLLSDISLHLDLLNNKLCLSGYSYEEILSLDYLLFPNMRIKLPNYNLKEEICSSVNEIRLRYPFVPINILAEFMGLSERTFKKYLKMSHEKEHIT